MTRKTLSISLLVITLAFLPACAPLDWIKKQFSSEKVITTPSESAAPTASAEMDANVLVSMDGKAVVTKDMLEQNYRQVLEERPDLAKLESVVKESLLQGLVRQAIVDRYVEEHDLEESDTYKKDAQVMAETCRKILNVKYFKEAHPVTVKDAEIKEYYESNKDTFPDLVLERGGIETMVVTFANEADAKAFLAKAKVAPKDFEKIAKEAGLKDKFRDYKFVNARSPEVDAAVKNAVLAVKTFPEVNMVQSGTNYSVVNAVSKKDGKYRPFDEQIKEGLRQLMLQEREAKVMNEEMAKLTEQYKVVVNANALKQAAQAEINFEDAFSAVGADQMAQADADDAQAMNQAAQVA